MTMRDAWKLWVRYVVRPAHPSQRPTLRAVFHDTWAAFTPLRNAWFWSKHPLKWLWVRRRVRWTLEGKGYLDA